MYWKMFKKQKLEELENASQENKVDDSITPLLNILNKHENIVTTSSCYGRIVLLEYDLKKGKRESNFYKKWHKKVKSEEVEDAIRNYTTPKGVRELEPSLYGIRGYYSRGVIRKKMSPSIAGALLWFKVEPFILHVACNGLESAKWFLEKIRTCGVKRGGIQTISKKVMIEVQGHGQIIFPLKYVKIKWKELIKIANDMMSKNAATIRKIEKAFKS